MRTAIAVVVLFLLLLQIGGTVLQPAAVPQKMPIYDMVKILYSRLSDAAEKYDVADAQGALAKIKEKIDRLDVLVGEDPAKAKALAVEILSDLRSVMRLMYRESPELRSRVIAEVKNFTQRAQRVREMRMIKAMEIAARRMNATSVMPAIEEIKNAVKAGNLTRARMLMARVAGQLRRMAANRTCERAFKMVKRRIGLLNATLSMEAMRDAVAAVKGIGNAIARINKTIEHLEKVLEHLAMVNASEKALEMIKATIAHLEMVKEHLTTVKELAGEKGLAWVRSRVGEAMRGRMPASISEALDGLKAVVNEINELMKEATAKNASLPQGLVKKYEVVKNMLREALKSRNLAKAKYLARELIRIRNQLRILVGGDGTPAYGAQHGGFHRQRMSGAGGPTGQAGRNMSAEHYGAGGQAGGKTGGKKP